MVDDKPAVIAGIRRLFAKQLSILVVGSAKSGSDAVEKVLHDQPDLVVMDVYMPNMDGLQAAAGMRRQNPEIRIIMTSIDDGADIKTRCLESGADSFLAKIGLQRSLMPEIKRLFPEHHI